MILPYFPKALTQVLMGEARALSFREIDLVAKTLLTALVNASRCHEGGQIKIVHSDIKPANILVAEQKRQIVDVKLADFGDAIFLNTAGGYWRPFEGMQAFDETCFGTGGWVAPEVALTDCREKTRFGQKIDVWSVGAIIYAMWTQKLLLPQDWVYDGSIELPSQILGVPPQDLIDYARAIPEPRIFNIDTLVGLEQNPKRDALGERQAGLKDYLRESNFQGRLLGDDQAVKLDEIDLFTEFLAQVLDTNPNRRLDPEQALRAWEKLVSSIAEKLDGV